MLRNDFDDAGRGPDTLSADGAGKTILCDCDGTMFNAKHRDGKGVNLELLDFLIAAQKRGYEVQLHSASPDSNNSNVFLYMRQNVRFKIFMEDVASTIDIGEDSVRNKSMTDSACAALTIDDRHGIEYVSKCAVQWEPNDARMHATMKAWGEPWISAAPKDKPQAPTPRGA